MTRKSGYIPPFDIVRSLFERPVEPPPIVVIEVDQVKADEGVLDRLASAGLALVERLVPIAVESQDPAIVVAILNASRETRACVMSRVELTGGGTAGGNQTGTGVTVRIEHSGMPVVDDFHAPAAVKA